jgi:hypothetical protein
MVTELRQPPENIRYLASAELQEHYIVNSTVEIYLLPDVLIDDAMGLIDDVRAGRRGRNLTPQQRSALEDLAESIHTNEVAVRRSTSNAELMKSSEWMAIRKSAQRVLATFDPA